MYIIKKERVYYHKNNNCVQAGNASEHCENSFVVNVDI